jgi:predicted Rossmann fold nucleotide-binding protein DprA/Smf involved in DNA uptake
MTSDSSLHKISPEAADYPSALQQYRYSKTLPTLSAIGNFSILHNKTIALFCSVQCPGDLMLKTYDLAVALRDRQQTVISGFHSPIEQECLTLLLCGSQAVIHCPARSLDNLRLKAEWETAIAQNRLLLLSLFPAYQHRATTKLAQTRNQFVAAIADAIFIAYANPNGKTIALAQQVLAWGKPLFTLASDNNQELITMGAKPLEPATEVDSINLFADLQAVDAAPDTLLSPARAPN